MDNWQAHSIPFLTMIYEHFRSPTISLVEMITFSKIFKISSNFTFLESFWIGARATTERGYHWETYNLEVQYSNYGVDPGCNIDAIDDNCLVAIPNHDGDEWHWCGISCLERKQFVCEFSTEPTTTTTPGPSSSSSTTVTSTPTSTVPSTSTSK